ncbi:MAG: RecQ family ATP-dependent DNA helicase [Salibacteraceae bacterium]
MSANIHDVLKKFWGYDNFRPLQQEIIESAIAQIDALALLPTGGGKSICFQVPALAQEGMCIVVSPLIALMNDQVQNLKSRDIPAIAITSLMSQREIDIALDNAVFGKYKFLYVSPERLQTEMFQLRIEKMKINLLAIDESHCISQWGYDFRPSYLNISELREQIPKVPVLALTATATPEVVVDIQEKLGIDRSNVFAKSFERKNLAYIVRKEEDKLGRLMKIIGKVGGSGIVYVRSRRRTEQIAKELQTRNIVVECYHAGLSGEIRSLRQSSWIKGEIQIIVATNAFGMGIDKPDVRWVVHFDLPDTLEAYFQEAGRAGRDEEKAFGILLYEQKDISELERKTKIAFPDKELIKRVYKALGSYYQLADGSGKGESYSFDLKAFTKRYNFSYLETFNAFKILEQQGLLTLSEAIYQPSRIRFQLDKSTFYNLEIKEKETGDFLRLLLRSYSGLLDNYVTINEYELSKRAKMSVYNLKQKLSALDKRRLIDYQPTTDKPMLTFVVEKLPAKNLVISKENYEWRKDRAIEKMHQMIGYVLGDHCRSKFLLGYFGEVNAPDCGVCDYCLSKKSNNESFQIIGDRILVLLSKGDLSVEEVFAFAKTSDEKVIQALEWLEEVNKIEISNEIVSRT